MAGYEGKGRKVSEALDKWLRDNRIKKGQLAGWLGCSADNLGSGRFDPATSELEATNIRNARHRDSAINRLKTVLLDHNIRDAVSRRDLPENMVGKLTSLQKDIYEILGEEPEHDFDPFEAARAGLAAYQAGNWEAATPALESAWRRMREVGGLDLATTMRTVSALMDYYCYVGKPEKAYGVFHQAPRQRKPRTAGETLAVAEAWNTYGVALRHLRTYRADLSVQPEVIVDAHERAVGLCKGLGEAGRIVHQRALRDSVYAMLWVFDAGVKPVAVPENAGIVLARLSEAQGMVGGTDPADGCHVEWLADCLTFVECASVLGRLRDAEEAWDNINRHPLIVAYSSREINVPLRSKMDMSEMPLLFAQGRYDDLYGKLVAFRDEELFHPYTDRQARVADAIRLMDRGDIETVWWPFVR